MRHPKFEDGVIWFPVEWTDLEPCPSCGAKFGTFQLILTKVEENKHAYSGYTGPKLPKCIECSGILSIDKKFVH
jgi:hypothetical protein